MKPLSQQFGSFEGMIEHWRNLPDDEKARMERESYERFERECAEQRRKQRIDWALRMSHIGERFHDRTFDTYDLSRPSANQAAFELAQRIAEDPSAGGWFYGGEGTGKTHLVVAIAHRLIERGVPCPFVSVTRLYDDIKSAYNDKGEVKHGRVDIVSSLIAMEMLILDDIDKPVPTPNFTERMYRLINDRYEAHRCIIVTSNYDPAEIALSWEKAGGKRGRTTVDRLIEMCKKPGEPGGRFARLSGPSLRGADL